MVDVTIQYRDGGRDMHYGVKSIEHRDSVLRIEESDSINVYIVLDIVSFFTVEEVNK